VNRSSRLRNICVERRGSAVKTEHLAIAPDLSIRPALKNTHFDMFFGAG